MAYCPVLPKDFISGSGKNSKERREKSRGSYGELKSIMPFPQKGPTRAIPFKISAIGRVSQTRLCSLGRVGIVILLSCIM